MDISTITQGLVTAPQAPGQEAAPLVDEDVTEEMMQSDYSIVQSHPLTVDKKIEALQTGDPIGLEHLNYVRGRLGEPMVFFHDDDGQVQFMEITPEKWMAGVETRNRNRQMMKAKIAADEEHAALVEEHQGRFNWGIDNLNDGGNPLLAGVLEEQFEKDPVATMSFMYDMQQLERVDEEKANVLKKDITNRGMFERSQNTFTMTKETIDGWAQQQVQALGQQSVSGQLDTAATVKAKEQISKRMNVLHRGMLHAPNAQTDMMLSPALALGPGQAKRAYVDWLDMLANGIPMAGGETFYAPVPMPSDGFTWEADINIVTDNISKVARMMGWQAPLGLDDQTALIAAIYDYHGLRQAPEGMQPLQVHESMAPDAPSPIQPGASPVQAAAETVVESGVASARAAGEEAAQKKQVAAVEAEKKFVDLETAKVGLEKAKRELAAGDGEVDGATIDEVVSMYTELVGVKTFGRSAADKALHNELVSSAADLVRTQFGKALEKARTEDLDESKIQDMIKEASVEVRSTVGASLDPDNQEHATLVMAAAMKRVMEYVYGKDNE